ncbi:CopG family ribbon-helix-helix protein [Thermosphaera sp.]|uniref:CopG family transcriptional regulator n=1 Tax=Thermosphaera aggregans TaxID=54254 RepID=A0A7C2BLH6_9CREN
MSEKRRFGISIPVKMADLIDDLARLNSCERSRIVEHALNEYLHENLHVEVEEKHSCISIIVAVSSKPIPSAIIGKYIDIVKASMYYKTGGSHVNILIIEGSSDMISNLRKELGRTIGNVRLIPLESMVRSHD